MKGTNRVGYTERGIIRENYIEGGKDRGGREGGRKGTLQKKRYVVNIGSCVLEKVYTFWHEYINSTLTYHALCQKKVRIVKLHSA